MAVVHLSHPSDVSSLSEKQHVWKIPLGRIMSIWNLSLRNEPQVCFREADWLRSFLGPLKWKVAQTGVLVWKSHCCDLTCNRRSLITCISFTGLLHCFHVQSEIYFGYNHLFIKVGYSHVLHSLSWKNVLFAQCLFIQRVFHHSGWELYTPCPQWCQ